MPNAAGLTVLPTVIRHRDATTRCAAARSTPRASPLRRSWAWSFDLVRQLFGLVFLIERTHQLIQVAVHHVIKLVQGEIDAMVRHAALRKIVGADAIVALAGPARNFPHCSLGFLFF